MTVIAGLFLIAHGLVHLAVWLPAPKEDAPFDPRYSWLFGDFVGQSRMLAWLACVVFVAAGILVLAGAGLGASLAIAGAVISIALALLTFTPVFLIDIGINVAIIAIVLT